MTNGWLPGWLASYITHFIPLSCLHDTLDAAAVTVFAVAIMVQIKKSTSTKNLQVSTYDMTRRWVKWHGRVCPRGTLIEASGLVAYWKGAVWYMRGAV